MTEGRSLERGARDEGITKLSDPLLCATIAVQMRMSTPRRLKVTRIQG